MIQLLLAVFGLTALWMAYSPSPRARRWSPFVGLLSQPAWIAYAVDADAWGLLLLSAAYTAVYARGAIAAFSRRSAA